MNLYGVRLVSQYEIQHISWSSLMT